MKILHLINYFNDNLEYQENKLINLQKNNGHDVCLITSDRYFPFQNYEKNYENYLGKRVIGAKKYFYKNVKIIRKKVVLENKKNAQCLFFNILDIIKFNPDIIHVHNCGTYTFISTFFYSLLFKKKVFVDCHQDQTNTRNELTNKIHNIIWKIIYKIFARTIIKFLPINNASKNFILKNYNINKDKIIISPLGYEKFNKKSFNNKKNLLKKNNRKEIVIINSGKQNFSKKTHLLVELTKILNLKNKNVKLILIGNDDGIYQNFLNYKIRTTQNIIGQNKIIRLPFLKKKLLRYYLGISDIAIWPGIPSITIQESLYLGNILMLPKHSASFNLISSEYLIFYDNLNKTANNLIKILENENLLNQIKLKNKNILKKLNWQNINKDLEKIYENKKN